ncbi:hypothetical protein ACFOW4_00685 [Micromonospora sp. GCM10011542]|uniref:hypothetical protein n=1 Tax=Micromonospora sp. GCM10011542 TaxID=3317337 RepID=UPI00360CB768
MSAGPDKENPRIDEQVREAERRLDLPADRPEDALTDEEALTPDTEPTERDAR